MAGCTIDEVLKGVCTADQYDPTAGVGNGNVDLSNPGGGAPAGSGDQAPAPGDQGVRYLPGPYPNTTVVQTYTPGPDPLNPSQGGSWTTKSIMTDPNRGGASGRNDALTAAQNAISDYLQASSLADSRRVQAFDQLGKMAQYALPPGAKNFPGEEPGGVRQAFSAAIGLPSYHPTPMTPIQVNPGALMNPAPIDPTVQALIGRLGGAVR